MPSRPFVEDFAIERYRKGGSTRYHTMGLGATTVSTLALTLGRLYGMPFFVPVTSKFDRIAIYKTTLVAGYARLGVYADLGTIAPGRQLLDSGEINTGTVAGVKEVDISATPLILGGGQLYWLSILVSTAMTVRGPAAGSNLTCFYGLNSALGTAWFTFCYIAQAYGALPDPFGAGITIASGTAPGVFLRKV